ncbi:nucleoside phosphorylase [Nocardia tenerifensis]|uniref:Nucleoside phosphorylase n=1 Tax=Nocardia tenerifensis TaxID=228006 RepID=A0A318L0Z0_9NOCA|nr:5'-methylthioadenosine/S-adenosylhomocysteine nucleosidase [Nocardia tenerifensis]PXX71764.1 nucleoside phosphorylase [Nocardia tenerifensis]
MRNAGRARLGTVVICTALEFEYRAVRDHLSPPFRERVERGTLYELAEYPTPRGTWTVALAQTGAGNVQAGVQLERAVAAFRPALVVFVGVAGGRKDVALGDVVVADAVYDYETGKDTGGDYFPRIKTQAPAFRLLQRSSSVARQDEWQTHIAPAVDGEPTDVKRRPRAFVKPIAAGNKVIADRDSAAARLLDRYCGDAVAVDMEGHGFLNGAYVNPDAAALVVRGISDLLSGKSASTDEKWQPVAARHAAAFTFELLTREGAGTSGRNWHRLVAAAAGCAVAIAVALIALPTREPSTRSPEIRSDPVVERDSTSVCVPDRAGRGQACVHPGPNLSGWIINYIHDTNDDLLRESALASAESIENNRQSCTITVFSQRNHTGESFALRPQQWANLNGTPFYHHLGSNRWSC